jgi:chemotaxis regulatin CheY-phosphate phosphatase CheZ
MALFYWKKKEQERVDLLSLREIVEEHDHALASIQGALARLESDLKELEQRNADITMALAYQGVESQVIEQKKAARPKTFAQKQAELKGLIRNYFMEDDNGGEQAQEETDEVS